MGVKDAQDLDALDLSEVGERLIKAPFPPSEKIIGAIMLKAVVELREVTANVAESSTHIDTDTKRLLTAARLTLVVSIIALAVSIIALFEV
jgi:hypothetical protein